MFNWFRKKERPRLPFATDVHCHLVPGIDDGSNSTEKSVELIRHMSGWGIKRIIPTPHVTEDTFENTPATIDPPYGELAAAVALSIPDVELLPPSAEYRIDSFFVSSLENGLVRPLRAPYILVENGFGQEPWDIDQVIFDLTLKGFKPILAHPERYRYYHSHLDRYKELHDTGLLFQVNLLSFSDYYGKDIKKVANYMLDNDLVDLIGTDIHGMRHIQGIEKFMETSQFRRLASRLDGRLLNDKI